MSEQPDCRRSGNSGEACGGLLHILQRGVVLFAGADLDHADHVVDKDLAIADVAGVQCLLGGFYHSVQLMRETMTSTLILGSRVVSTGTPRYFSGVPFWMPQPMTCVTVMPVTPRSFRAVLS